MELNRTQRQGEWKSIADTIDLNFGKVATEVESLNYATRKNKGYFATGDALTQSVPTANVGEIAYVGTSSPFTIYKWENGWVNTGYEHTDSVELGDYVTADVFNTAKSNLQEQIDNHGDEIESLKEDNQNIITEIDNIKEAISNIGGEGEGSKEVTRAEFELVRIQTETNKSDIASLADDVNAMSRDIGNLEQSDDDLSNEITQAENRLDERIDKVRDNLEGEITRAKEAEQGLSDRIDNLENNGGGGGSTEVIDDLSSTSKTAALSANQGRVLDGKITELAGDVGSNSEDTVRNADNIMTLARDLGVGDSPAWPIFKPESSYKAGDIVRNSASLLFRLTVDYDGDSSTVDEYTGVPASAERWSVKAGLEDINNNIDAIDVRVSDIEIGAENTGQKADMLIDYSGFEQYSEFDGAETYAKGDIVRMLVSDGEGNSWERLVRLTADYNGSGTPQYEPWNLVLDTERSYTPDNMGYVILRKELSFAEQVTKENTIYEIRYDFDLGGETVTIPSGCVLKFEGGRIRNGKLTGNETQMLGSNFGIFDNINIEGEWNVPNISTNMFITKTGEYFLQNVMNLSSEKCNNKIVIEEGEYNISFTYDETYLSYGLRVKSNTDLVINGNICVNKTSVSAYRTILVANEKNVTISGSGSIIGDKDSHIYEEGSTHEWCHGIHISESKNISVSGIDLSKFPGDGICVTGFTTPCEDINVANIDISECRRQGISVIFADGMSIENCRISGILGTDPQSAIDLEPNEGCYVKNIAIKHLKISNCITGLEAYGHYNIVKDVRVEDVEILNPHTNARVVNYFYMVDRFVFDNIRFYDTSDSRESIINIYMFSNSSNVVIKNNYIETNAIYKIVSSEDEMCKNILVKDNRFNAVNSSLFGFIHGTEFKNNAISCKSLGYYVTSYAQPILMDGNVMQLNTFNIDTNEIIFVNNSVKLLSADSNIKLVVRGNSLFNGNKFSNGIDLTILSKVEFFANIVNKLFYINGVGVRIFDNEISVNSLYIAVNQSIIKNNKIIMDISDGMLQTIALSNTMFSLNFIESNKRIEIGDKNGIGNDIICSNNFKNVTSTVHAMLSTVSNSSIESNSIITGTVSCGIYIGGANSRYANNIFTGTSIGKRFMIDASASNIYFDDYGRKGGIEEERPDMSVEEINDVSARGKTYFNTATLQPSWWNGSMWCNADGSKLGSPKKGTTQERPESIKTGYYYFDTSLNKPIWYNGDNTWVDAAGETV